MPKLVVQPFLENAYFHAFDARAAGCIHVFFGVRDGKLVCEIMDDGVIVKDHNNAEYKIAADSVILSTGYKPRPLAPKSRHIHLVGDCDKVGNLRSVIWQAWDVAMKL